MVAKPTHVADAARIPHVTSEESRRAVEVTVDYLSLPVSTLTPREGVVHVTVVTPQELSEWRYQLGGRVEHTHSRSGAALWTLHTQTPERGSGKRPVTILVHAAVVDGDEVLSEMHGADAA